MNTKTLTAGLFVLLVIAMPATAAINATVLWSGPNYDTSGPGHRVILGTTQDGQYLFNNTDDGGIALVDAETGDLLGNFGLSSGTTTDDDIVYFEVGKSGEFAYALTHDTQRAYVLDIDSMSVVSNFSTAAASGTPGHPAQGPMFNGQRTFYAAGQSANQNIFWFAHDGTLLDTGFVDRNLAYLEYDAGTNHVYGADDTGNFGVWKMDENGTVVESNNNPSGNAQALAVYEDVIMVPSDDGNLYAFWKSNMTTKNTTALPVTAEAGTFLNRTNQFWLEAGDTTYLVNTDGTEIDNFSSPSGQVLSATTIDGNSSIAYGRPGGIDMVQTNISGAEPVGPTPETSLELEIDRWMPFNSTQEYTVLLNTTNTTSGDTTFTDVTADANVTVYNITNTTGFTSPIVTVDNTSNTLVSHKSTGVVAVNATYDGMESGPTNLTVGNRNLSNIGIMPPSQWISSFLEVDSSGGPHGIGSPTQWILFIVLIMSAASRMFDNPWAGIGAGVLTAVLMWVMDFIGLGVALSTVFIGILLSLMLIRARRSRVTVNTGRIGR